MPRCVEAAPGGVTLGTPARWRYTGADPRLDRAVRDLQARVVRFGDRGAASVVVQEDAALDVPGDGYRLIVRPGEVLVQGRTAGGCFHALQTLEQLVGESAGEVPCGVIRDWPDYPVRGLLLDVTRGRVPTLRTMKQHVAQLARLKINQLQLYIEHAFVFSFDSGICGADEGLTHDEIRELDAWCRDRFITLVPAVASPGHMGRILSMPRYRHLAEVEATQAWESAPWPQRLRGLTLDTANPEAWRLMESMWTDILAAFSSSVVNICGDEPWDLGEGKNKERCLRDGKADPYLGHLRRLQDLCAARGRSTQFWGDVVRGYPHLLDRLRPDGAILHWGYDERSDYEGTAALVASGLPTMVCPGTSGWKRTLSAMSVAERNIATFAAVGRRAGAAGFVNTDWGDHGHFNLDAASRHGVALGACCAWRADHPTGEAFDRRVASWVTGCRDARLMPLARAAARLCDACESWRLLWMNADVVAADPTLPALEYAVEARQLAEQLAAALRGRTAHRGADPAHAETAGQAAQLALAADFTALAAEKCAILCARTLGAVDPAVLRRRCAEWAQRMHAAAAAYADDWRRSNKPLRLGDIETALNHAVLDMQKVCDAATEGDFSGPFGTQPSPP